MNIYYNGSKALKPAQPGKVELDSGADWSGLKQTRLDWTWQNLARFGMNQLSFTWLAHLSYFPNMYLE